MQRDYGISINWEEVHAITHGLHDNPHHILGPHMEWDGVVVNAYVKDALKVEVIHEDNDWVYEMRASGIADFFTLATDEKNIFPYRLRATYRNGSTYEYVDAYRFEPVIDNMEIAAFSDGIDYEAYKTFGAHKRVVDGVEGMLFVVWAPNAQRVSVVGEFNLWEGSRGLMRRLYGTSVFELFVPGIEEGIPYKYEIRTVNGDIFMKSDPYAARNELAPADASVTCTSKYRFKDSKWIKSRDKACNKKKALNIYEVNLFELNLPGVKGDVNYRTIAPELAKYVKDMGYTHVEIMPVMDSANEASNGYETRGFYAVSSRLGEPADFKYLVDYLHRENIGVILDWAPYQFGREESGLYQFDGGAVYEDSNPLRAYNPSWGTMAFNYGRKEVSNFLISNALYWVEEFHADGLRIASVASMLYLDYGRSEGEWLPNIYNSNENLDAVEFFKHLNSIMKKRNPGVIMIAEDSSLWPNVTASVDEDGLGFDYKLNMGWTEDMMDYASTDIVARRDKHNALTFSLLYAYSEQYMYGFGHSELADINISDCISGNEVQKKAAARALIGYLMMQPGKKYMYMQSSDSPEMMVYKKALNKLYLSEPALYEEDYEDYGFEWINNLQAKDGLLVFLRKTKKADDTLLVVCNFSNHDRENFKLGVPYSGKYKEIFNSDMEEYGGEGNVNVRMRQSKDEECDARANSIVTNVPAFGISIYKYNVAGSSKPVKKSEPAKKTETEPKKAESVKKTESVKKAEPAKKAEAEKKAETEPKKSESVKKTETAKKSEPVKKAETEPKKSEPVKKAEATKKAEPAAKKEPKAK